VERSQFEEDEYDKLFGVDFEDWAAYISNVRSKDGSGKDFIKDPGKRKKMKILLDYYMKMKSMKGKFEKLRAFKEEEEEKEMKEMEEAVIDAIKSSVELEAKYEKKVVLAYVSDIFCMVTFRSYIIYYKFCNQLICQKDCCLLETIRINGFQFAADYFRRSLAFIYSRFAWILSKQPYLDLFTRQIICCILMNIDWSSYFKIESSSHRYFDKVCFFYSTCLFLNS
jgi:hypothetical protein